MGYSWGIVRGKFEVGDGTKVDLETLLSRWQKFCSDGYADDFQLPVGENLYHFRRQNINQTGGAVDVTMVGDAHSVFNLYTEKLTAAKLDDICPSQADIDKYCSEGSSIYVPSMPEKFLYEHAGRGIYQYAFPPYQRIDPQTARDLQYGFRFSLADLYGGKRRRFERYIFLTAEFCTQNRLMFEFVYDSAAFE